MPHIQPQGKILQRKMAPDTELVPKQFRLGSYIIFRWSAHI